MANVRGNLSDDLQEYIPNVCTNSPSSGSAFCAEHCKLISGLGYPTGLREFFKSCASAATEQIDPENFTKQMQQKVDAVLKQICNQMPSSDKIMSCAEAQGIIILSFYSFPNLCCAGTEYLLQDKRLLNKNTVQLTGQGEDCNK